jgi:hypothetical protein
MQPNRRNGASNGEILLFLILLGVGVMVCLYLNQTPKVVQRTVIVEKEAAPAPPPPPPAKPPPVVKPPPAQIRAPIEPQQLPETVVVYTPSPPACIAIGKRLRIAQQAAVQINLDITTARQAALDQLRQSSDYQSLKADLEEKKKAKDDALSALQKDNAAGNDTDQDSVNVRAADLAWADQVGVVTHLENQTVADDQTVNQKLHDLKDIQREIADQQMQMEDYIYREINSVCDRDACHIDDVKLDPDQSTIQVDMTPQNQPTPGAMADAALNDIGAVLETLSKSPFTWQEIRFRICGQTKNIVEYQLTYSHNATADISFELLHMSSLLYPPIHTADLHIGTTGILFDVKIMNIIDDNNMIVWLDEAVGNIDDILRPVWIRGISTVGRVTDSNCDITTPLEVTRTIQYTAVSGAVKTIFMLEPARFNQNLVIGDYYNNYKLIALAQNIWLNPTIDCLQGRQPLPDSYIRQPGTKPPELFNTLQIGGYSRVDGSLCPVTLVHSPHPLNPAQPNPPTNNTPPLPFPYNNTNPVVSSRPPPQGF